MNHNEATLEVIRKNGVLSEVRVLMPVWDRIGSDGKTYIKIPLLGIETYGKDAADIEIALKEAVICFCIAAERHGRGLEKELESIGWSKEKKQQESDVWSMIPSNTGFDSMMQTGVSTALSINNLQIA